MLSYYLPQATTTRSFEQPGTDQPHLGHSLSPQAREGFMGDSDCFMKMRHERFHITCIINDHWVLQHLLEHHIHGKPWDSTKHKLKWYVACGVMHSCVTCECQCLYLLRPFLLTFEGKGLGVCIFTLQDDSIRIDTQGLRCDSESIHFETERFDSVEIRYDFDFMSFEEIQCDLKLFPFLI